MTPRHRLRFAARVTLSSFLLLTAAAWLVSHITPIACAGLGPISLGLGEGRAWILNTGPWPAGFSRGLIVGAEILPDGWIFKDSFGTWRVNRNAAGYSGISIWPVFAALAAATTLAWHRPRIKPGHCRKCRYDLRATPTSPSGALICPECGRVTSAVPPAANNPRHEGHS